MSKCETISLLPPEIFLNITIYLDALSLFRLLITRKGLYGCRGCVRCTLQKKYGYFYQLLSVSNSEDTPHSSISYFRLLHELESYHCAYPDTPMIDIQDIDGKQEKVIDIQRIHQYDEILKVLVRQNTIILKNILLYLYRCSEKEVDAAVDLLISYGCPLYKGEYYSLFIHALESCLENTAMKLFSLPFVNPSAEGGKALFIAAKKGRKSMFRIFQEDKRVDISLHGPRCVFEASKAGNLSIVQLLVDDTRVALDGVLRSSLGQAVANNHADIVELLLTRAGDQLPEVLCFSLQVALSSRNENMICLLLRAADTTNDSFTVYKAGLEHLIRRKNAQMMHVLMNAFSPTKEQYNYILELSQSFQALEIIEMLQTRRDLL